MDLLRDPYPPPPPPGQDELPSEDGQPMDTPRHRAQMNLLIESLETGWAERDDYYVGGNMFVYFSDRQSKGEHFRGPDVFVVLDTERRKERKSWIAWHEGGRLPNVVIELMSPSTEQVDRGEKKRVYEQVWRVEHYVLFDPYDDRLEGFELVHGRYEPLASDGNGRLRIGSMGLWLGLGPGTWNGEARTWLRWFDADGRTVPTPAEAERAKGDIARAEAESAKAEADAAKAAVEAAKARIAELEATRARR